MCHAAKAQVVVVRETYGQYPDKVIRIRLRENAVDAILRCYPGAEMDRGQDGFEWNGRSFVCDTVTPE